MTVALVLVLSGAACEAQDRPGQQDPGVPISYALTESRFSVGGQDDRPEFQLHQAVGAVLLTDGRLVVADGGSRELRYYDSQGRHLLSAGGSGEGPGEFRTLRSIARIRRDTVAAWDPGLRRVSFFGPDGQFATAVNMAGWDAVLEELQQQDRGRTIALYQMHVLEAGELVGEPFYGRVPDAMEETQVVQDTIPLVVFDRRGEPTRLLGPYPAGESFLRNRSGMLLRFGERLRVAAAGDLLYVGSTRNPVIRGVSTTGNLVRSISMPVEPRRLEPADVPDPGQGPVADLVEAMPLPDSMPLFSGIRYGADGRLWVQSYRAPLDRSQEWLAFDGFGDLAATLTMDASLDLLDIGSDHAVVLATDELDVEEIRVHPLTMR